MSKKKCKLNWKWFWFISVGFSAIILVLFVIRKVLAGFEFSNKELFFERLGNISVACLVFSFIFLILSITILIFPVMRDGLHYLYHFEGDDFFKIIDECKSECKYSYQCLLCYRKIDELYEGREINEYIKNAQIEKLLNRKVSLKKAHQVFNYIKEIIIGMCVSLITSLVMISNTTNLFDSVMLIIIIAICIIVIGIIPYGENKVLGYMNEVDLYEIEKIDDALHKIQNRDYTDTELDAYVLAYETQKRIQAAIRGDKALRKKYKGEIWINGDASLLEHCSDINKLFIRGKLDNRPITLILNKEKYIKEKEKFNNKVIWDINEFKGALITEEYRKCFFVLLDDFAQRLKIDDCDLVLHPVSNNTLQC